MNKRLVFFLVCILYLTGCTTIDELSWKKEVSFLIYESDSKIGSVDVVQLRPDAHMVVCEAPYGSSGGGLLKLVAENSLKVWSKPDTIVRSTLQCAFPTVAILRDGLILTAFGMYRNSTGKQRGSSAGLFIIQSYDNGRSFTVPRRIPVNGYTWIRPTDKILERNDGSLLLPLDAGVSLDQVQPVILISSDRGETWDREVKILNANLITGKFNNAKLVFLSDGRLFCMLERRDGDGYLYTAYSTDGGLTWSQPERSNIMGYASDVIFDSKNRLICAYCDAWPEGISTMNSFDYGKTWENEVQHIPGNNISRPVLFRYKNDIMGMACLSADSSRIIGHAFHSDINLECSGFSGSCRNGQVNLRWNKAKQAAYYVIFRDNKNFDAIAMKVPDGNIIATATQPFYIDANVEKGQTYWYRVAAVAGCGRPLPETGNMGEATDVLKMACE